MSELEEESRLEEIVFQRHRQEIKQLKANIQQMKKSVNKDKKRKKEMQEEIANLEKNLNDRHAAELAELKNTCKEIAPEEIESLCISANGNSSNSTQIAQLSDEDIGIKGSIELKAGARHHGLDLPIFFSHIMVAKLHPVQLTASQMNIYTNQYRKLSRAEKKRQKKAQESREREQMIKEAEEMNRFSARNVEADKIKNLLREKNLQMHEINPDGNCLYAAIAHQLGTEYTTPDLRTKAAEYLRSHADDFIPFITEPSSGELLTLEKFEDYCDKLQTTSAWGGQPELRALSQDLEKRIEVLQAEGSPIIFGEEFENNGSVLLAYYRHYYGLGEHYNSVEPLQEESEFEEHL